LLHSARGAKIIASNIDARVVMGSSLVSSTDFYQSTQLQRGEANFAHQFSSSNGDTFGCREPVDQLEHRQSPLTKLRFGLGGQI